MTKPRILFLGQKPIGEACLKALLENSLAPVSIVTNRDTERVWWKSSFIWETGQELNIPLLDNDRRRTDALLKIMHATAPDVLLSVQHQWILPAEILSGVPRAFNLHLAPLPSYKGYNCFNHAILNREENYGVTLHHIAPEVDAGPTAYEERFAIAPRETAKSLYEKSFAAGLRIFRALLSDLLDERPVPSIAQSGVEHFYSRESLESFREVANDAAPEEKDRRARAFYFPPFDGAFMREGGHKVFLSPS